MKTWLVNLAQDKTFPTRFWIHATDGHPNAEGQRIIAETLAGYLAPLLPPAGMVTTEAKP